jgi:antitoxin PrlF
LRIVYSITQNIRTKLHRTGVRKVHALRAAPQNCGGHYIAIVLPSHIKVTLAERTMPTTLTSKGQVTIPKRIRDELHLLPGAAVEFSVNAGGELVLQPARRTRKAGARKDRFEAVRGRADIRWRTDELMKLLREEG